MPDPSDYWSDSDDPYSDPGTKILKNIPSLKTQAQLDAFEEVVFQGHFTEATDYAEGCSTFNFHHWQEIHGICFAEIYEWAGEARTVRLSKGSTVFAYPENIESEANRLLAELSRELSDGTLTLEKAAEYYAELNVVHPFREGNGRTQRVLFAAILKKIGYQADYAPLDSADLISSLIQAYNGDSKAITALFRKITKKI